MDPKLGGLDTQGFKWAPPGDCHIVFLRLLAEASPPLLDHLLISGDDCFLSCPSRSCLKGMPASTSHHPRKRKALLISREELWVYMIYDLISADICISCKVSLDNYFYSNLHFLIAQISMERDTSPASLLYFPWLLHMETYFLQVIQSLQLFIWISISLILGSQRRITMCTSSNKITTEFSSQRPLVVLWERGLGSQVWI